MQSFVIEGGHALHGEVTPSGNKNAALPLLAACLLTDQPVRLRNLPDIGDVRTMRALVEIGFAHRGRRPAQLAAPGDLGAQSRSRP
ncbi:MAG TPA: UDP-N-acetylglucosamine 1-carboxyvinyltransferase, partial [Anaerolineales bacterium]|nr:UDP-N-acetylglucosamine 1-carboxyvinyltransferase [Anaerolineales bacterium]